jgi:hypothetical protein
MTQPPHSPKYLERERHADGKKSAFQKTSHCTLPTACQAAQPTVIYGCEGNWRCFKIDKSCSITVAIHTRMLTLSPCPALKEIV